MHHLHGIKTFFSQCSKLDFINGAITVSPTHPEARILKLGAGISLLFHLLFGRCSTACHTHCRRAGRLLTDAVEPKKRTDCFISRFQWLVCFNVYSVQLSAHLPSRRSIYPYWDGVTAKWLGVLLLKFSPMWKQVQEFGIFFIWV